MEEYMENVKNLRSYMNDLEEEEAKRSAEEQRQRRAIDTHDTDLAQVRAQAKQVGDEAEQLAKERAQVCVDVAEKQGRIAALEVECATLKQTLELLHQEIASTSTKLDEKRLSYTKTMETLTAKLREQQEWHSSNTNKIFAVKPLVEASQSKQNFIEEERNATFTSDGSLDKETEAGSKHGELKIQLESAQLKIEDITAKRSLLLIEMNKSKQVLEQEKNIMAGIPPALQQMDMKSLEEEYRALQGDKAGEAEYVQSLEGRIKEMKGISDPIKCSCGHEYKVDLCGTAMGIS